MSLSISSVPSTPINKLTQYTKDDFTKILNAGFSYNLDAETMKIIQSIADQVGAPEYIRTPKFEKREYNNSGTHGGGTHGGGTHGGGTHGGGTHGGGTHGGGTHGGGTHGGGTHGGGTMQGGLRKPYKERVQEITDADWESIRQFQATIIAKKQGIEASIDQIRKHLNKMTTKTYDTLKEQIITEIKSITADNNVDSPELLEELNKIGESLFTIASGNSFYSKLYAELYKDLMEVFDTNGHTFMEVIFKNNFQKFRSLFDKIDYCSPDKDYDGFCNNTKTNEKRRALSLFYVNLMKLGALEEEQIIAIIKDLQNYMLDTIKKADSKDIVDELVEVIFILITNGNSTLCKNEEWENIMNLVKQISVMKNTAHPSITNKTIFKHMDILDTVQKK
jgi:hypothetical protein